MNNDEVKRIKKDFPILKNIIYVDSGASTQKPKVVIDAISNFYSKSYANIHRGVYDLSQKATELYDDARNIVAKFINANFAEIVFTKGTTEALNLLSFCLDFKGSEIVLTEMEHHANLVPWQQLAKRKNMKLKFIKMKDDFTLDYDDAQKKITNNTAIVAFTATSNVFGTNNDVKSLIKLSKKVGAYSIIDAAQLVPHSKVDVKNLDCDFLAFSGHKMLGPTGIGVLYGKEELLDKMEPFNTGGDMIGEVKYDTSTWNELPTKFEAGTPNIAGAIGLGEAIKYLEKIGMDNIEKWEKELLAYALKKIQEVEGVTVYNPGKDKSAGILSFNIKGLHPHDVASLLSDDNVCIRGGHHCAMPLMSKLGINGTCRASFYLYNTYEDVDKLIESINKAIKILK
tara:strand:+ start:171 stop:1364 length:1194 start_codon:yes stop_codon:yes gene_type:complete